MRNSGLNEAQAGIAGRNINHLRYADDTTLMAEGEEELKSLLALFLGSRLVYIGLLVGLMPFFPQCPFFEQFSVAVFELYDLFQC